MPTVYGTKGTIHITHPLLDQLDRICKVPQDFCVYGRVDGGDSGDISAVLKTVPTADAGKMRHIRYRGKVLEQGRSWTVSFQDQEIEPGDYELHVRGVGCNFCKRPANPIVARAEAGRGGVVMGVAYG